MCEHKQHWIPIHIHRDVLLLVQFESLINIAANIYDECKNLWHFATNWIPLFTFARNDKIVYALCHELQHIDGVLWLQIQRLHAYNIKHREFVASTFVMVMPSRDDSHAVHSKMSPVWRRKSNIFVNKITFEWHKIDNNVYSMVLSGCKLQQ